MALGVLDESDSASGTLRVRERLFCGTLTPSADHGAFLAGIANLLTRAQSLSCVESIRLDVPPAFQAAGGAPWLPSLIRLVSPSRITAIAAAERQAALSRMFAAVSEARTTFLVPDPAVRRKSAAARELLVAGRIAKALEESDVHTVDPFLTVQVGTSLGNDASVPMHRCLWAGATLGMPICHGILDSRRRLTLWTTVRVMPTGWEQKASWVAESLGASRLRIISLDSFEGLILGIHGSDKRFHGLGRLVGWDPDRNGLSVRIPRSVPPEGIGFVEWGQFRVDPDGRLRASPTPIRQKRGTPEDAGVYFG